MSSSPYTYLSFQILLGEVRFLRTNYHLSNDGETSLNVDEHFVSVWNI